MDKGRQFYSQQNNLLPPKPKSSFRHLKQAKSSFRHLKQGIQEFRLIGYQTPWWLRKKYSFLLAETGSFFYCLVHQGPVVQSIVSLTTSLRRQLVKYMPTKLSNTLLFLLEKCENLLHSKIFSHFFNKK